MIVMIIVTMMTVSVVCRVVWNACHVGLLLNFSAVSLCCLELSGAGVDFNAPRFLVVTAPCYFGRGFHVDSITRDTGDF